MKKDCRTCLPERKSRQFDFTLAGTRGRDQHVEIIIFNEERPWTYVRGLFVWLPEQYP